MNNELFKKNKSAIEFHHSIHGLLSPFFDVLKSHGFSFFTYFKIFENGTYAYIGSNEEWVKYYLTHVESGGEFFPSTVSRMQHGENKILLFPSHRPHEDEVLCPLFEEFGIWNWIRFQRKEQFFFEGVAFGTPKEHSPEHFLNFYINNVDFLKSLTKYFLTEYKDVIYGSNQQKWACFQNYEAIRSSIHSAPEISTEVSLHCHSDLFRNIKILDKKIELTHKEFSCLSEISKGKTAKEIALNFQLSPRTVEYHLNSIKAKTGYRYKSDLVKLYYDHYDLDHMFPDQF